MSVRQSRRLNVTQRTFGRESKVLGSTRAPFCCYPKIGRWVSQPSGLSRKFMNLLIPQRSEGFQVPFNDVVEFVWRSGYAEVVNGHCELLKIRPIFDLRFESIGKREKDKKATRSATHIHRPHLC
jgi:hypothetical protein